MKNKKMGGLLARAGGQVYDLYTVCIYTVYCVCIHTFYTYTYAYKLHIIHLCKHMCI